MKENALIVMLLCQLKSVAQAAAITLVRGVIIVGPILASLGIIQLAKRLRLISAGLQNLRKSTTDETLVEISSFTKAPLRCRSSSPRNQRA